MSKKARIRRKKMHMLKVRVFAGMISFALTLAVLLAGIKIMAAVTRADDIKPRIKCYHSVEIEAGETLWDIAEREMGPGWSDVRAYIKEVEELNGINGSVIKAGEYICLPYYKS